MKLGVTPWRLGLGEQDMVTAVIATPAVSVSFPASMGPGDTACFTVTSFHQLQMNNREKKKRCYAVRGTGKAVSLCTLPMTS